MRWPYCYRALRKGQIVYDLLPLFAPHDSSRPNWARFLMRRFKSCRPSQQSGLYQPTWANIAQTAWRACYGGDTNHLHGLDDTGATQPVTSGPSQEMSDCCGRLEF